MYKLQGPSGERLRAMMDLSTAQVASQQAPYGERLFDRAGGFEAPIYESATRTDMASLKRSDLQ